MSRERSIVDCVAFGYAYAHTDNPEEDPRRHFSICNHPERGVQHGCLLTDDLGDEREIKRKCGRDCSYRIKRGRKGSAKLEKMIAECSIPF